MKAQRFYGWRVGAALWFSVFVNLGFTNYGGSAISAIMAQDMHFDRSVLGLAFTFLIFSQGLAAPIVALGVNRVGIRLTMCVGSIVVAIGAIVLGHLVARPWQYVLVYGLVIGLGGGLGSHVPAQACIALWFERNRSVALSIVLAAVGVGGFVAAPLLTKIIVTAGGDWRKGWDSIAALTLLAGAITFVFVKNKPSDCGQLPDGGPLTGDKHAKSAAKTKSAAIYRSSNDWLVRDALATRALWLISLASISYLVPLSVFVAHAIPHLRDLGNSLPSATMGLSIVALCSIAGKLGAGFLCDRFEPRYIFFVALLVTGSGALFSLAATDTAQIYLFAVCLGLGYGGAMVCGSTLVANYFGGGSFASIMGVLMPITTTVSSLSPFIVGMTYDIQGSYTNAFMAIALLSFMAGTLLLLFGQPPQHHATRTDSS